MRTLLLTLLFIPTIFISCNGQTKLTTKEFVSKEFNWRINIPAGFEPVATEQWVKMQNRGADAIADTYNTEVENKAKTIFVLKSDQFNYFESNWQPFELEESGDYVEQFRNVNNLLYGTFEAQMPGAQLDSASSQEEIGGLVFQTFRVRINFPNKMVMEYNLFSRLFGNKEFTVNIMTVDKSKQQLLLDVWRKSKFSSN